MVDSLTGEQDAARIIGPILFLDDIRDGQMHLAALFLGPADTPPPPVEASGQSADPILLTTCDGRSLYRARFALPADAPSSYAWNGQRFDLASDLSGDIRIGYVSCNGKEHGDLDRDMTERNAMWHRLGQSHGDAPFSLLLHGGDQIYADEITHGHALSDSWPDDVPSAPDQADLDSLRAHLERALFRRYAKLYSAPEFSWLAARVPSLTQWDDHDICDGWGSLAPEVIRSAVGQCLFECARRACLMFQHACRDGDLPPRFADPGGAHLGWTLSAEGLRILAPDLRSERTRQRVMGPGGWEMMEQAARPPHPARVLLMSSVPLLGPRLSILEAALPLIPGVGQYEDDLRDQWQSRAHRAEWQRFLRLTSAIAAQDGVDLTAVSGEIHMATRASMRLANGKLVHQLVASGIAHPPPSQAWARALGFLGSLGESPLPGAPIRIQKIPGQPRRYVADRNFLTLTRRQGQWSAQWVFEHSGPSPMLVL